MKFIKRGFCKTLTVIANPPAGGWQSPLLVWAGRLLRAARKDSLYFRGFAKPSKSPFPLFDGFLIVILTAFIALQACSQSAANRQHSTLNTQNSTLNTKYAQGFSVSHHQDYKLIKVFNPFVDQSDTLRYVLIPRGSEPPEGYSNAQVIETPVESLVVTGTTHVALAEMLNATEIITGIGAAKYVYNPAIRQKLETGEIVSFSIAGLNKEKLVAMNPDLVMIAAGSVSSFNDYRLLIKLGIPVFINADWLETTPLGRTEWVKVMGALLNVEALANKKFKKIATRYNELRELVAEHALEKPIQHKVSLRAARSNLPAQAEGGDCRPPAGGFEMTREVFQGPLKERPLVITGLPYKGAWFVPGGNSFTAQYLKDAGADYPWFENDETGGLQLNFEAVYYKGLKADIWINPGSAKSIQDILAKDSRFGDFKSVQTGRVYNKNKRMSPAGGNDFWETGAVRPDLVLHDLINIFHPGLLESDTMYFYQKLPQN